MRQDSRLRNEEGAVLVVALMMLVLLTILGISISSTSEVELQIAGNEMRYKQNMYRADAAAMACAQVLDQDPEIDIPADPNDEILSYTQGQALESGNWVRDDDFWEGDPDDAYGPTPVAVDSALDSGGDTHYIAVFAGVPPGEDFESGLREFTLYGRTSGAQGGRSVIKMGYRRVGGIVE